MRYEKSNKNIVHNDNGNVDNDGIYKDIRCVGNKHPKVSLAADLYANRKAAHKGDAAHLFDVAHMGDAVHMVDALHVASTADTADAAYTVHAGAADDGLFIMEGCWAYEKLLLANIGIDTMLVCPELIRTQTEKAVIACLIKRAAEVYRISEKVSRQISDRDDPDGSFLICRMKRYCCDDLVLGDNSILMVLDGLEKPGNIGTAIRTAEAAGADAVIICNSKVRLTHHGLVKASMGSSFMLPVISDTLDNAAGWLKANRFRIILTDLKATQYYHEADYSGRVAIVAGNEIRGISDAWSDYDCERVIIPMFGKADSLNVGFAAALVVYEAALRQKLRCDRM